MIFSFFEDDGFGNFQLFSEKQLEADIETSGRDNQKESEISITVTFHLGTFCLSISIVLGTRRADCFITKLIHKIYKIQFS